MSKGQDISLKRGGKRRLGLGVHRIALGKNIRHAAGTAIGQFHAGKIGQSESQRFAVLCATI